METSKLNLKQRKEEDYIIQMMNSSTANLFPITKINLEMYPICEKLGRCKVKEDYNEQHIA